MLKSFARRLSRRLGSVLKYFGPEDFDDSLLDQEKNLYKREIVKAAQGVDWYDDDIGSSMSLCETIETIGCLAYTGGPPATKCAGQFIPQLCDLLGRKDIKIEIHVAIMKCISIICFNHAEHQEMCCAKGLLQRLSEFVSSTSGGALYWAIYCLHNALVGNIQNLQIISDDVALHPFLFKAMNLNWPGFKENYAQVVLQLLGLRTTDQTGRWGSIPEENASENNNVENTAAE